MKIALCISGQPRLVSHGYKCIHKNIIQDHKVDTFIHTWYDSSINSAKEYGGSFTFDKDIKQTILDLYKPIDCTFEPPNITFPGYENRANNIDYAQYCMFYSIKHANNLKIEHEQKCGFEYDVVIRTRFDAGILQPINFKHLNKNNLYSIDAINNPKVYCDWLLYGDSKTLDKVCKLYDHINELRPKVPTFCGEELLAYYLKDNNIICNKIMERQQGKNLVLIRETHESAAQSNCWIHYTEL